jgi:hypothetical protein
MPHRERRRKTQREEKEVTIMVRIVENSSKKYCLNRGIF